MNKKNIKLGILVISLITIVTSVSYAYYQAIFKDERTENNTNLNTEFLSSNVEVKNISGVPGSFSGFDIYPGHKEVAGMEVKISGESNSRIGVKFTYEVLENGLNDNVKVSLYKSKEKIDVTENYFECQKQTEKVDNETRFYETCEDKSLELLIAEKTLIGGEETIELVTDTVYVENTEETYYYYIVVEFLNKATSQNEVMNRVLNGNIKVELGILENKTFEESVVAYGNLGNNIAKSMLYSSYLDKTNLAYDDTVDNNLRYIGKSPSNYVYFNCDDYNNPTVDTCEKWRIIGAMNNIDDGNGNKETRIKLIRSEPIGNFSWDTSTSTINNGYGVNEWSRADLMKLLNPGYDNNKDLNSSGNTITVNNSLYWNSGSGTCYLGQSNSTTTCNFTNTGLKNETTRNMIGDVIWHTGSNGTEAEYNNILTTKFYELERSSNTGKICTSGDWCNDNITRITIWKGKIGLMYPSDYGYITSGGANTNRNTCLSKVLYNWNNSAINDCKNNDWLYNSSQNHWTISPCVLPSGANNVFMVRGAGFVDAPGACGSGAILPALYLSTNVKFAGGNGDINSPFTLSQK